MLHPPSLFHLCLMRENHLLTAYFFSFPFIFFSFRLFFCSDRILTCRIKSIRSPAKVGTGGCYRFKYQPGSTLEGVGDTPPPSTAAQLSFFAQPRLSKHLSLRGGLPSSSASLCLRFGGWIGPSLGLLI